MIICKYLLSLFVICGVAHKISQFETTAVSISFMYNNDNICCSLTSTKRLVAYWGGKNIPKKCDRNLKNDKKYFELFD